ncbi:hypothetical protein [Sorangium sp. So ce363]|uniref:hypothetical protein n=1 Tax=Sorangium sp. So ce363 TaxID=3133304 RepID=UPI003F611EF4
MGVSVKDSVGSQDITIFEDGALLIKATVPKTISMNQQGDWEGSLVTLKFYNSGQYQLTVDSIVLLVSKQEPNNNSNFRTRWKETLTEQLTIAPPNGLLVPPSSNSYTPYNAGTWQWWVTSGGGGTAQGYLNATSASYHVQITKDNVQGTGAQAGPNVIV